MWFFYVINSLLYLLRFINYDLRSTYIKQERYQGEKDERPDPESLLNIVISYQRKLLN